MLTLFSQTPGTMDKRSTQHVVVEGVEQNGGGQFKISLKLALFVQLLVIASGIGGTYAAVRAGIEADRQKIEEQSESIRTLQVSVQSTQQTLTGLTTAITFLSDELKSMQERLWNDRRH